MDECSQECVDLAVGPLSYLIGGHTFASSKVGKQPEAV